MAEVQVYLSGVAPTKGPSAEPALLALIASVSPSTKQIYELQAAEKAGTASGGALNGSPGSDVADSELLAWLARVAASNDLFALAEVRPSPHIHLLLVNCSQRKCDVMQVCVECTLRTKGGASPSAKVLADLASADILSRTCTPAHVLASVSAGIDSGVSVGTRKPGPKPPTDLPRLDPVLVNKVISQRRADAIKSADRALQNALSIGDCSIVEECCTAIWNLSLPLLQPATRMTAYRPLFNAAAALESIESTRVILRAHIHYEVARCEIAADFLAKAAEQLTKALALDYGANSKEPAEVLAGHRVADYHVMS